MSEQIAMPKGLQDFLQSMPTPAPAPAPEVINTTEPVVPAEPLTTATPSPVAETTTPAPAAPEAVAPVSETTPDQNWWESPSSEPVKKEEPAPAPTDVYEKKAKLLDNLMSKAEFKYLAEGLAAGKDLQELVKDFNTVDYSKLDAETVFKHYGQLKGWTDDEVSEEIGAFNEMRKFHKEDTLESMIAKLNEAQAGKLAKVTGGYREEAAKQAALAAERDQFIENRLKEELQKEMQYMEGKEFFGTKLTKEDAAEFQDFVMNFDFFREDGTYNIPLMRTFYLGSKKLSTIQKANFAAGKTEGTTEILKEIHRPAESSAAATKLPEVKKPVSKEQGALQAAMNLNNGRAQVTHH